jgi:pimeloyl-ACP methyl ester carboxylesterase
VVRVPPLVFKPDELYRVPTEDGSTIVLGRYFAREQRRYAWPIVFAHGLGTNRFALDFDERYSFARAFAAAGFEAWVFELRGHGLAGDATGSTFDVEATFDVQAALQAILSTGVERVGWLGHSRGGLLALAHVGRFHDAPIGAICAIASPTTFEAQPALRRFVQTIEPALKLPTVPLTLARTFAPFGLPNLPINSYFFRPENVEPVVVRQALAYVTADLPGGVARQFARWVADDIFTGEDGFDYRVALKQVNAPTLLVAGAGDSLVPPASGFAAQRWLGGPVQTLEVSRAQGFSVDAGHGDLLLGRAMPGELRPKLIRFFQSTVPHIR